MFGKYIIDSRTRIDLQAWSAVKRTSLRHVGQALVQIVAYVQRPQRMSMSFAQRAVCVTRTQYGFGDSAVFSLLARKCPIIFLEAAPIDRTNNEPISHPIRDQAPMIV